MAGCEAHDDGGQSSGVVSDLIGAELAVAVIVWLLLVFAAFFFIGAVLGLILVAAG